MRLFIELKNGQPVNHPLIENNLKRIYPYIDVENLPVEFANFKRVKPPIVGVYEKNLRSVYELGEDGTCRDVWYVDQMTEEEKLAKQNSVKEQWANNNGYSSWIFNETTCSYQPPIPYPTDDGKKYVWDEATASWIEHVVEV